MTDADQLKAYLADRDVPCPGCGYNLRGVAEPVCPECDRHIALSLRAEHGTREASIRRFALFIMAGMSMLEWPTVYFTVSTAIRFPQIFEMPIGRTYQYHMGGVYGLIMTVGWAILFARSWKRVSSRSMLIGGVLMVVAVVAETLFVVLEEVT